MTEREPVENTGSTREKNCTLECSQIRTSWICDKWTAGLTAGNVLFCSILHEVDRKKTLILPFYRMIVLV